VGLKDVELTVLFKKEALPDMKRSPTTTRELRLAITDMTYEVHSLQYLYYPSALTFFDPEVLICSHSIDSASRETLDPSPLLQSFSTIVCEHLQGSSYILCLRNTC